MRTKPPVVTSQQRRRLQAALIAEIAHLNRCLPQLARVHPDVYKAGVSAFGSSYELAFWLCGPVPSLGHRRPLVVTKSKAGQAAVLNVLGCIEHGVYL